MDRDTTKAPWATDYFKAEGTVVEWWDPTSEEDEASRAWFEGQLDEIFGVCPPWGRRVLDAATGRGRAAVRAAGSGAALVTAVDISSDMLQASRAAAGDAPIAFVA